MDVTKISYIHKPDKGSDLELMPYPFCGSEEVAYVNYETVVGHRWAVTCYGCMATIDPGYAQQKTTVQEKWNRRVEGIAMFGTGNSYDLFGNERSQLSILEEQFRDLKYKQETIKSWDLSKDVEAKVIEELRAKMEETISNMYKELDKL